MGIKKAGKRLLKLAQKTAKALGEDGRKRVEELFSTAIAALERELQEKTGLKAGRKATPGKRPHPPAAGASAASTPREIAAKGKVPGKQAKPARPPRRRAPRARPIPKLEPIDLASREAAERGAPPAAP
jgi:hypothetical protein